MTLTFIDIGLNSFTGACLLNCPRYLLRPADPGIGGFF